MRNGRARTLRLIAAAGRNVVARGRALRVVGTPTQIGGQPPVRSERTGAGAGSS